MGMGQWVKDCDSNFSYDMVVEFWKCIYIFWCDVMSPDYFKKNLQKKLLLDWDEAKTSRQPCQKQEKYGQLNLLKIFFINTGGHYLFQELAQTQKKKTNLVSNYALNYSRKIQIQTLQSLNVTLVRSKGCMSWNWKRHLIVNLTIDTDFISKVLFTC